MSTNPNTNLNLYENIHLASVTIKDAVERAEKTEFYARIALGAAMDIGNEEMINAAKDALAAAIDATYAARVNCSVLVNLVAAINA